MKRIVEKYSELMVTLEYARGLASGAVIQGRRGESDAYEYIDKEIGLIRENKNNEILLSEVKEGSIVCVLHRDKRRVVSTYTDRPSVNTYIIESRPAVAARTFIDKWVKKSNTICYVAKDYKQALKWLVKEDSQENNDILITED